MVANLIAHTPGCGFLVKERLVGSMRWIGQPTLSEVVPAGSLYLVTDFYWLMNLGRNVL